MAVQYPPSEQSKFLFSIGQRGGNLIQRAAGLTSSYA